MTLTFAGAAAGLPSGKWSVDHAADIFDPPGWEGFWIVLVAGFGGAAGLLATFWRPPPPKEA